MLEGLMLRKIMILLDNFASSKKPRRRIKRGSPSGVPQFLWTCLVRVLAVPRGSTFKVGHLAYRDRKSTNPFVSVFSRIETTLLFFYTLVDEDRR